MRKAWIDEDRPKAPVQDDADFIDGEQQDVGGRAPQDGDISMFDVQHSQINGDENATATGRQGTSRDVNELRSSSPIMLDDEDIYNEPDIGETSTGKAREGHEPDEDELDALLAEDALQENASNHSIPRPVLTEKDDFADEEEAMAEMGMW